MPLGREVDVGPGDIVLDGDPAPSPKEAQPSIFGSCLLWPNGRLSQLLLRSCCTAHGRKYLYFTMGASIHQNCHFAWADLDHHLTHDANWAHASPQPKRHLDRFSRVCTDDCRVSL